MTMPQLPISRQHFSPHLNFDGTDNGPVKRFIGVEDIPQSPTQKHLSQEPLARELLARVGMSN